MKHFYLFILGLLLLGLPAISQTFVTKVSAKFIGKKDQLQVDYIAENIELSDFKLPKFLGWEIQSGPNFSSSQVQTGNQVKQQIIYSFILQPTRPGKLSIPSATITIDKNNSRQSNTLTIDVKDVDHVAGSNIPAAPQFPSLFDDPPTMAEDFSSEQVLKKGENAQDKIKNNLLIKLDVSKTSCYVGEPVIATYKLCTRLRSESKVVKQPEFVGCTVTEITNETAPAKQERINGKMYNVYIIRKIQLYPLQGGALVLPAASVENKVSFYKEANINFRDLYYNNANLDQQETVVTLSNKPVTIDVKTLPTGAPTNYSGAIGKFRITALPANNNPITTKNTAGLQVVIEGEGNLQEMKAPTIQWPAGIEGFDSNDSDEVDKANMPIRVRKTITYPFLVNKSGNYTIPPVHFTYFEPSSGKYISISSQPLAISVAKGSNNIFSAINSQNKDNDGFKTRLYLLLAGGLVAIAIGLLLFNKKSKTKTPMPAVVATKPTVTVQPETVVDREQFIHNIRNLNPIENDGFYKQLKRNILEYLKVKYNVDETGIEQLELVHSEETETLQQIKLLLQNCSLGIYTPMFNTEEEMQHRLLAIELLTRLEKTA